MRHFRRARRDRDVSAPDRPLVELLEEMQELRLTLAADLTAAAGAAEAGAGDVARDIIEADQTELARFARVANLRLERLSRRRPEPQPTAARPAWRRRVAVTLPVVPVVGAMAFSAAAATGVIPLPGSSHQAPRTVAERSADEPWNTTFAELVDVLDSDPSASQVIAAATKLHKQLRHLMATSSDNPGQAQTIATLLRTEQLLLLSARPPGADVVLDAAHKLAAKLAHVAPDLESPSVAPTFVPTAPSSPHRPKHNSTSSPTPAPTKTSTKPAPAPSTQPSTSTSPAPTATPWPTIPDN